MLAGSSLTMESKAQTSSFIKMPFRVNSNRIGFILILLGLLWGLYLIRVVILVEENHELGSEVLKGQIIELSKKYIKSLAREHTSSSLKLNRNLGTSSTEELKRTTAVLLQSMLDRIENVEEELHLVIINSTLEFAKMHERIHNLNISMLRSENRTDMTSEIIIVCEVPEDPKFPECSSRVKWLQTNWNKDRKYLESGVNGSLCSILIYLSHVEQHCPINFPMTKKVLKHNVNERECDTPTDAAYPHCQQKIEWMKKFWTSDPKYASHGVDGSMCSYIKYLSEVESWCGLLPGRQKPKVQQCDIPKNPAFPNCGAKVAWMRQFWTTDPCYAKHGVNGSICSFLVYLSEVEHWCPLLQDRTMPPPISIPSTLHQSPDLNQFSLHDLLKLLEDPNPLKLKWIKTRMTRLWPSWVLAQESLKRKRSLTDYNKKKILVYIGLLSDEQIYHFGAQATKGGPLGELVQWSDLISSLYLLGHDLIVTVRKDNIRNLLLNGLKSSCPTSEPAAFDVVYTDYIGVLHINRMLGNIDRLRCHLRIVDSFGTEAEFNNPTDPRTKTFYGSYRFNLKQFNTMFPHSPDNSFLGFVVENSVKPTTKIVKKPIALVYGKHPTMWEDHQKTQFLDVINKYFEVHATVASSGKDEVKFLLPRYVKNHGILSGTELQTLLREAKVFVGMGFPFEGPAPLEAIANGCFFINVKYDPPIGRENSNFFKNKPTFRRLTSQHPYAEKFIGPPYVHTLNLGDRSELERVVKEMRNTTLVPYLPYEFTFKGMLERLYVYLKHQDFCNKEQWPPLSARKVFVGDINKSCQETCDTHGLICEPTFFGSINNKAEFKANDITCSSHEDSPSLVAPSLKAESNTCLIQTSELMYSCTAKSPSVRRLCPCRDFIRGNTAFCKGCQ